MQHWKELVHRTDLTPSELSRIPGASCENYIAMKNYYIVHKGFTEDDLLDNLDMSWESFNNPKNWMNPLNECRFYLNIIQRSNPMLTHHDLLEAGKYFQFSSNSLFMLFFRALPAWKIILEIEKNVKKFNNEYAIIPVDFRKGSTYLIFQDYPFYNQISLGTECRFTEGVLAANFEVHGISRYSTKHLICGKILKNIITQTYGHLELKYEENGRDILVNGSVVGRKVALAKKLIDGRGIFFNETDESSDDYNAVRITTDVTAGGRIILFEGEYYNAPYCLVYMEWDEPSIFRRLLNNAQTNRLLSRSLKEIEQQIEFTNIKLFELEEALGESERRLSIMKSYTRSSLVEKIQNGEDPSQFKPVEQILSVWFNDIREFTNLSESMEPFEVVDCLNNYFTRINNVITQHNGEIDKLIGDCIMAFFMSPDDSVTAAVEARYRLQKINIDRIEASRRKINNGTGITCGPVIIGNIGSDNKMDYTLIGNTVNIASRIEALTKIYRVGIVISEEIKDQITRPFNIRYLDNAQIIGKTDPVKVYEVFDYEPEPIVEMKINIQKRLDEAMELYCAAKFADAAAIYDELERTLPRHRYNPEMCADPLVSFYLHRTRKIIESVEKGLINPDHWHGVFHAKTSL